MQAEGPDGTPGSAGFTRRILVMLGTRPEAIKLAPVIHELHKRNTFDLRVCSTGQHRDMLQQALMPFDIRPDFDLDLMDSIQDLHDLTARVITGARDLFQSWRPDRVIVHGDTTTCLASTLAAFYAGIPVAHVEAGLRTGDLSAPFPEEGNRAAVARLADLHFAPTPAARDNLLREAIPAGQIHVTGNTVIDALLFTRAGLEAPRALIDPLLQAPGRGGAPHRCDSRRLLLVTGHRRENFGEPLQRICQALQRLAESHADLDIVYPVHLNPRVLATVQGRLRNVPNVHLLEPLDYRTFVAMLAVADLVLTDSGGIQEEAPALGKPVLVMRDATERPEAIAAGTAELVGTGVDNIVRSVHRLLTDPAAYRRMASACNPFGDGKAAPRIVDALEEAA